MRLLAVLIAAAALLVVAPAAHGAKPAACRGADLEPTADTLRAIADTILCVQNRVRAERALPPLKANARLALAAARHTRDMVLGGAFDHVGADGATLVDRVVDAKYVKRFDGWMLGENLAWATGSLSTPQALVDAWLASSEHRSNLLSKDYRDVGIGVRLGVPGGGVAGGATVTVDFGAKACRKGDDGAGCVVMRPRSKRAR